MLDEVDKALAPLHLDDGDPLLPVQIDPIIDILTFDSVEVLWTWDLPECVHGLSTHEDQEAGIAFNLILKEWQMNGYFRRARYHEWGHLFRGHEGQFSVGEVALRNDDRYDTYYHGKFEREADIIASYIGVRKRALEALKGQEPAYIASLLEMPVHTVKIRQGIVRNYGR